MGLIHRKDINLTERNDLKIKSQEINGSKIVIEDLWYETNYSDSRDNYVIGVVHKHPGCSVECLDYFTQQMEINMSKISKEKKKCIITGDINIDRLKVNMNTGNGHVNNFFKTMLNKNFIPTITLPTRIIETQISLIDHIFTNTETFKNGNEITTGNIYSDITDHLPNFIIIKSSKTITQNERPLVRIFGD